MVIYTLVTRNGQTSAVRYEGMTQATIDSLVADLGGTLTVITESEYNSYQQE